MASMTRAAISGVVSVVGAHGAASVLTGAARGLVAHEFVDDPGRDAGVLQPSRVGVAEVVGAMQVDRVQQGVALDRQRGTAAGEFVLVLDVDRSQAGAVQLPQVDRNRGRLGGAAGHGQSSRELVDTLRPPSRRSFSTRRPVGRRGTARSVSLARAPW
jgi:hypothetical protein